MTPPVQRTGPTLAIVGNCKGCRYLRTAAATRYCARWSVRNVIGYTYTPDETPSWCPELAPARLALGRALVAADITGPARGVEGRGCGGVSLDEQVSRARCDGCVHLDKDYRRPRRCTHDAAPPEPHYLYPGSTTPAWCPEMGHARGVLGRELAGEAPTSKATDRWFGGFIAALSTLARYPAGMTAKGIMQEHGVTIADLRESAQGVPQEIDDIERSR